jgi:hypothetical protein
MAVRAIRPHRVVTSLVRSAARPDTEPWLPHRSGVVSRVLPKFFSDANLGHLSYSASAGYRRRRQQRLDDGRR